MPASRWALLVITLAAAALTGCAALRLTYGQGATVTYWWLDGYADFTRDQAPRVKAALAQWFAWHRRTQLPDYTALLERARHEVRADTTPAQTCAWWDTLMARRDTALRALAQPLAEIVPTLSADQLAHVSGKFDRSNEKWRDEHLQPDPRKRERAAVERAVEQAEKLYGRLHAGQKDWLAAQVRAAPVKAEQAYQIRLAVQRESLQVLQQIVQPALPAGQALALSQRWLQHFGQPGDAALLAQQQRLSRHWCEAAAGLHNRTDAEQREHAAEALQGWRDDAASFLAP